MKKNLLLLSIIFVLLILVQPNVVSAGVECACPVDHKLEIINNLKTSIQFIVPFCFILYGLINFLKVGLKHPSSSPERKKAFIKLIKNILTAVFVFFVLLVISVSIDLIIDHASSEDDRGICGECWIQEDSPTNQ